MKKPKDTTIHDHSNSCTNFRRHIYAHYAGNNSLGSDTVSAHQIFQTSIMTALIEGVYEGSMTYAELEKYGDFGLGTFNDLDGEMVAFDGCFYQLRSDGTVARVKQEQKTPFATVVFFKPSFTQTIDSPLDKTGLEDLLNNIVKTDNHFFAIRVDGIFTEVKTRTVSLQQKPYKPMTEVTDNQAVFTFKNLKGTLAGFKSPDYAQGLTVAGYHLHFINEAKEGGGHVLDFTIQKGVLKIDHYSSIFVSLPETPAFEYTKMDKDSSDAIKKSEG